MKVTLLLTRRTGKSRFAAELAKRLGRKMMHGREPTLVVFDEAANISGDLEINRRPEDLKLKPIAASIKSSCSP